MEDTLFDRYERAISEREAYRSALRQVEGELARLAAKNATLLRQLGDAERSLRAERSERRDYESALESSEQRLRAAEDELAKLRA